MSTPETLSNIFFDPGATFEALRARPRFLVAALLIIGLTLLGATLLFQRVDFNKVVRQAMEGNPRTQQMSAEEKERAIAMQSQPVFRYIFQTAPAVGVAIMIAAGAGLYLLGAMLMGGRMTYKQALSVWTYSSFAPGLLQSILTIVLLYVKSPDDLDFSRPGAGLLVTNLGALLGSGASPVLRALLSWFDLFTFYGMYLAATGLRIVARLSSGAAWTIVLGLWLLCVLFGVARAALFGG
jgi:hypothetical protein